MRRKASKQEVGCTDRGSGKRRLCWHFALQLFLLNFLVTPVKMHPISNIGYFLIIKEYLPIKERLENTENYRKLLIIPTISLGATDVSCSPWVTPLPACFFQQRCNCYMLIILGVLSGDFFTALKHSSKDSTEWTAWHPAFRGSITNSAIPLLITFSFILVLC